MEYDVKFKISINDQALLKQLHRLLDYDQRELFIEDVPKEDLKLWRLTDDIPIAKSVELGSSYIVLYYENPEELFTSFYEHGKKLSKMVESVEVGVFSGGYGAKEMCVIKNGKIVKKQSKEI